MKDTEIKMEDTEKNFYFVQSTGTWYATLKEAKKVAGTETIYCSKQSPYYKKYGFVNVQYFKIKK